jgi:hypothetical protein
MSTAEALKQRGFTITPIQENRVKIGNQEYIIRSVFTGKNQKSMNETFLESVQKQAFNALQCPAINTNDSSAIPAIPIGSDHNLPGRRILRTTSFNRFIIAVPFRQ